MSPLDRMREALPDDARDVRLNLQAVLQGGSLDEGQRWGVAVAAAAAARHPALLSAVLAEARSRGLDAAAEDGLAAAALMAMNNVYYRFRHMVGKPGYSEKPARLRMGRLAQPATSRADLELFSLAASAINGCEACVRAHEDVVVKGGLGEEAVHDAVRIAAVIHAAAVALELGEVAGAHDAVSAA